MNPIGSSLESLDVEQYLFAFLFLMTYSIALGRWAGPRTRRCAAGAALAAAAGFAGVSDPWEQGVLVMAAAVVAVGGLSAASWLLWALMQRRPVETPAGAQPVLEPETTTPPRQPALAARPTGVASV